MRAVFTANAKKFGGQPPASSIVSDDQDVAAKVLPDYKGSEFLNSVESSLFGEFTNGQSKNLPAIRVKKQDWVELICFKPLADNEQMHQQAVLSCEKNWVDECLAHSMQLLNCQDMKAVNGVLEGLSQIHSTRVQSGEITSEALRLEELNRERFFTEDEREFLNLFKQCFKPKAAFDSRQPSVELEKRSLEVVPHHLVFAKNLLSCLRGRDSKIKLLHTLNCFRSVQRRLTLDLREMGTRDRVMGDAEFVRPKENEKPKQRKPGETTPPRPSKIKELLDAENLPPEEVDFQDHLVDLNKFRFNKRMHNQLGSTCPVAPRFHAAFGQPMERQELSFEYEMSSTADFKKQESKKLLGRADFICKHQQSGLWLVKDDFGVHVLYDAAFVDMRSLETEMLKLGSFFINKLEPVVDTDIRNIYPSADRLAIVEQLVECEAVFQEAKLKYILTLLECYEHTSDVVEQQRLIQSIVDEMAKRPRINLNGTHFRDSYMGEVQVLKQKTRLLREVMRMLIKAEFKQNNSVREYLELTYRLLHEGMENKWTYERPEKLEEELNKREMVQTGVPGSRDAKAELRVDKEGNPIPRTKEEKQELQREVQGQAKTIFKTKFGDPKEFANQLGMPFSSLQMLMKDHHERDPLVNTTIHEHVSFIKIQEGYPQFIYKCTQL